MEIGVAILEILRLGDGEGMPPPLVFKVGVYHPRERPAVDVG